MCDTNFSREKHDFTNPNSENVQKWISKGVSKFHDDPTIDEYEIIVLLEQVLDVCEKRENSVWGTFLTPQTLSRKYQRWMCENKF